jgi:hypothetical protein
MNSRKRKGGRHVTVTNNRGDIKMNVTPTSSKNTYKVTSTSGNHILLTIKPTTHINNALSIKKSSVVINKKKFNTNIHQTKNGKKIIGITTNTVTNWFKLNQNSANKSNANKSNIIKKLEEHKKKLFRINEQFKLIGDVKNKYKYNIYNLYLQIINTSIDGIINQLRLKHHSTYLMPKFLEDLSKYHNYIYNIINKDYKNDINNSEQSKYLKEIYKLFIENKILDQITSMQKSITSL